VLCCTGRGAVEAFPSGVPRTSRSWSVVEALRRAGLVRDGPCTRSRRAAFCCGLIVLFFIIVGYGYPHTVGTDKRFLETMHAYVESKYPAKIDTNLESYRYVKAHVIVIASYMQQSILCNMKYGRRTIYYLIHQRGGCRNLTMEEQQAAAVTWPSALSLPNGLIYTHFSRTHSSSISSSIYCGPTCHFI
jgi:hypothetical protein